MSLDPLDMVWRCADNPNPVLSLEEFETIPTKVAGHLTEMGVLRQTATATHVTCDACAEQHVEEVERIAYPDGETRFFITCPENGRVEVPRERLLQWSLDYLPLFRTLSNTLSTSTQPEEVVPGRAWNLGRAALAGRSRPIWAARGLAWPDAARVAEVLPRGRSVILFFTGRPPADGLLQVPRESVIEFRAVVRLGNDRPVVDVKAIEEQLSDDVAETARRKPKKRSARTATIDAVKQALREHLRAARDHAYSSREPGKGAELLPRPSQQQLADQFKLHVSSISRAINDPSDREISILWQAAADLEQVMKFKG